MADQGRRRLHGGPGAEEVHGGPGAEGATWRTKCGGGYMADQGQRKSYMAD